MSDSNINYGRQRLADAKKWLWDNANDAFQAVTGDLDAAAGFYEQAIADLQAGSGSAMPSTGSSAPAGGAAADTGSSTSTTAPATTGGATSTGLAFDLGDTLDRSKIGTAYYDAGIENGMPALATGTLPHYDGSNPTRGRTYDQTPLAAGFFYPKDSANNFTDTSDVHPAWGNLGGSYQDALPNGDMNASMPDADKVIVYRDDLKAIELKSRPLNDNDKATLSPECNGKTMVTGALYSGLTVFPKGTYIEYKAMLIAGLNKCSGGWTAGAPYADLERDQECPGSNPTHIHLTNHGQGWTGASNPNDPSISPSVYVDAGADLSASPHVFGIHRRMDDVTDHYIDGKRVASIPMPNPVQDEYFRFDNYTYWDNPWFAGDRQGNAYNGEWPPLSNNGSAFLFSLKAYKVGR